MHLCNSHRLADQERTSGFLGGTESVCLPTTRFGFPVDTCCGFLTQPNDWSEHWDEFFIRNRLQCQVNRLIEKGDRDIVELWPHLQEAASKLLAESSNVPPALVHGDLWSGNWGFAKEGPVVFDPASFYADSEYEQGIIDMFGGLSPSFWKEYHKLISKRVGRDRRVLLYELYHHFNHWNHFGGGYKSSSLSLIHKILNQT